MASTLDDVAKLAGVSNITVSRVVNNKGNVAEITRQRILDAIQKLNYVPNSLGRALNRGRIFSIGVLAPLAPLFVDKNNYYSLEADLYFAKLLQGVEEACYEKEYDLLISTRRQNKDGNFNYFRLFHQRKVDGLIFLGAEFTEEHKQEIEQNIIPCCVIGDDPGSSLIGYVDSDNKEGMSRAVERLIELGHTKIAFLGVSARNKNIEARFQGFLQTLEKHNISFPDQYYLTGDYTGNSGGQAVAKIMTMKKRPTALVCSTDYMGQGALKEARRQKIPVPGGLSILGFDGFEFGGTNSLVLTSVQQPLRDMGYKAALLLIEKIEKNTLSFERIIFPVKQVPGDSVGKPEE